MHSWLPGIIGERNNECQSLIMIVYDSFTLNRRDLILLVSKLSRIRRKDIDAPGATRSDRIVLILLQLVSFMQDNDHYTRVIC